MNPSTQFLDQVVSVIFQILFLICYSNPLAQSEESGGLIGSQIFWIDKLFYKSREAVRLKKQITPEYDVNGHQSCQNRKQGGVNDFLWIRMRANLVDGFLFKLGIYCSRQDFRGIWGFQSSGVGERISGGVWQLDGSKSDLAFQCLPKFVFFSSSRHYRCRFPSLSLLYIKFYEQLLLSLMFAYKLNLPGLLKYTSAISLPPFNVNLSSNIFLTTVDTWLIVYVFFGIYLSNTMEKGKKSFKTVICSTRKLSSEQNVITAQSEQSETRPTMVEKTISSSARKEKGEAGSSGTKKDRGKGKMKLDMVAYLAKLSGVKENINHLKQTSLFGFIIGDPIDIAKIRPKLRNDWKMKGEFLVHERANGWFELRFGNPIDRNKIWDGRPYHIFGQLLLLKPWKSNFDTATEAITQVDMWIRIPQLPVEYLSFDVLNTIIEWNNMGTVIKLDPYTEKQQRLRYARLCINVDLLTIHDNQIIVPDENATEHTYKVWFEDFPKGCGNCGDLSHCFNSCPLREVRNQPITVTLPKPAGFTAQKGNPKATGECVDEGQWEFVGKTEAGNDKGKGVLPTPEPFKKNSIHVIYKTDSSSLGSKESKDSKRSMPSTTMIYDNTNFPSDLKGNLDVHCQTAEKHSLSKLGVMNADSVDKDEQGEELMMLEDFLMDDDEGYGGELSQEEIEALIAKAMPPGPMEESQSLQSHQSLANASSVLVKMEKMEVKQPQTSNSESSKRKGSVGIYDTATSTLKGGEASKKQKAG